jgi:carbon storage regulator
MAMLVLSRKLGERIVVPHCELAVTVVAIEGSTVRLGITAPAEIGVYREELWQRVQAEGQNRERPADKAGKEASRPSVAGIRHQPS